MSLLVIVSAALVAAYLVLSRRLGASESWSATVTPLASIMGSGFLISAPLLGHLVGTSAVVFMLGLLVLAYAVGGAIRFNIRHFEPIENQTHGPPQIVAFLSRAVLVGAYFISVAYYLQLLAAFVLHQTGIESYYAANIITSLLLVVICGIGGLKGLASLEKLERYAVALNLGMIASLLVALVVHNLRLWLGGEWALPDLHPRVDSRDLRTVLGLLIVVQGFETSRYLGGQHPAGLRITTMRRAQLLSGGIYLLFVALATVLFEADMGSDVTAILNLTAPLAVVLPLLLVAAALGSQFSAAVADTAGAGGLLEDLSQRKLPARYGYLIILLLTLAITWGTDVHQVIALASRAFALFYALQCGVAFLVSWHHHRERRSRTINLIRFALLTLACLAVFFLGLPAES